MNPMEDASTMEQTLMQRSVEKRIPMNGSLELLPLCNMNCDMCYVRLSKEEMERQGRLRTLEEWVEVGRQMQKAGVLFLLLTGGEPLLYPDFRKLYLELKKMGMIITINTNGTLIDEETAEFFGRHKPRRINITLYGADNETYENLCHHSGGYDKVTTAIRLLKKKGVDVKVSSSLTQHNQDDMDDILDVGKDLDVPIRIDTYMMPAERERCKPFKEQSRVSPEEAARIRIHVLKEEMGEEQFRKYVQKTIFEVEHILPEEKEPNRMSCYAGKASFTINWQGQMRPCVMLTEPAVSVFEKGFEAAWRYIVRETDQILLCSACNACNLRPVCRNCAACALLESGSYDGKPDYMCRYVKASYECLKQEEI